MSANRRDYGGEADRREFSLVTSFHERSVGKEGWLCGADSQAAAAHAHVLVTKLSSTALHTCS